MKKLKSGVWEFFKICKEDDKRAECTLCDCNVSSSVKQISRGKTRKSFSTKPLWNHLQGKHTQVYLEVKNHSEKSVDEYNPSTSSTSIVNYYQPEEQHIQPSFEEIIMIKKEMWSLDDPQATDISKIICEMMALDAEPFSLVEREGFARLIQHLAPQYPLPNRTYFTQQVMPELHHRLRCAIKEKLSTAAYISFAVDIWTMTINNESFISLTGHYLSPQSLEREAFALYPQHFPGNHKGHNIPEFLSNALEEWDIPREKVHVIVQDNATNTIAGTNIMVAESVGCFIRSLQLVIQDAIFMQQHVVEILEKCRKIVTHFSQSSFARSKLETMQENLRLPTNKLVQDVSIRWNSTFYMLMRLHEQKQAVTAYAAEYDIPTLTAHQWSTAESIIRVLKPFDEITKQASVNNESIGYVIPAVVTLNSYLAKREKDAGVLVVKRELQKSLHNRFLSSSGLNVQKSRYFVLATFLDPRYKAQFLQDLPTARKWMIDESVAASINDTVTDGTQEQLQYYQSVEQSTNVADNHEDIWQCFDEIANNVSKSDPDSNGNENNYAYRTLSEVLNVEFERQRIDRTTKKITAALTAEIDRYIAEPLLSRQENPLLWWRFHALEYPELKMLSIKYLSAPPSSVISERLFSAAERIYTENRNRLLPENAEMLLFLMNNIKILNFVY